MFFLGHRNDGELERIHSDAHQADLTYAAIGTSLLEEAFPTSYHHLRMQRRVGERDDFGAARDGLGIWAAHRGAGLRVYPSRAPVEKGVTVLLVASAGPLSMIMPCRIVATLDDRDRYGFAYGTLPGHPEHGEESFVLSSRDDGSFFEVTAFSRPAELMSTLAGPLGTAVQHAVTRRYLSALERYVRSVRPDR